MILRKVFRKVFCTINNSNVFQKYVCDGKKWTVGFNLMKFEMKQEFFEKQTEKIIDNLLEAYEQQDIGPLKIKHATTKYIVFELLKNSAV